MDLTVYNDYPKISQNRTYVLTKPLEIYLVVKKYFPLALAEFSYKERNKPLLKIRCTDHVVFETKSVFEREDFGKTIRSMQKMNNLLVHDKGLLEEIRKHKNHLGKYNGTPLSGWKEFRIWMYNSHPQKYAELIVKFLNNPIRSNIEKRLIDLKLDPKFISECVYIDKFIKVFEIAYFAIAKMSEKKRVPILKIFYLFIQKCLKKYLKKLRVHLHRLMKLILTEW